MTAKAIPDNDMGLMIQLSFRVEVAGAKDLQLTRMEYNHLSAA
jgi:hypothetical protein